ncbi:MAG: serine/threonine protein kinase [Labilithrix sp.]|nr:serine/threonine protein kinase [Labilithrix sp.]
MQLWQPGETIADRYRLERLLGEGGMGAVWAATHLVTRKLVAIKTLKPELTKSASLVERFLREARAACAVRHPNVVQIHDVLALESGVPIMIMDFLEGESLGARLLRQRRIPLPELSKILLPVFSAVSAAHAASIVHRDLKPDNLFLVSLSGSTTLPDGTRAADDEISVKVLDFGVAKITAVDESTGPLTKTGAMLGTPFYMSPEQLFGEKDVDTRSDIWALGVIIYECLTGRRPTEADNLGQITKLVTVTGIPPIVTVKPNVPADVNALVARMLTRDRTMRPSLDEAREVFGRYATGATPHASLGPMRVEPPPTDPPLDDRSNNLPWASSNARSGTGGAERPGLALVLGLAGLLVTAAVVTTGVLLVSRLRAPPPTSASAPSSAPAPPESADAPAAPASSEPPTAASVVDVDASAGTIATGDARPATTTAAGKRIADASAPAQPPAPKPVPAPPTASGPLEEKPPF